MIQTKDSLNYFISYKHFHRLIENNNKRICGVIAVRYINVFRYTYFVVKTNTSM